MPKEAKPLPELSEQQKEFIRNGWQMDRVELVRKVFSNPTLTLRNIEAKAVNKYIAELGLGMTPRIVESDVELSEAQKEYVKNHIDDNPVETTRLLFQDKNLSLNSPEGKAVLALCKILAPDKYNKNDEPVEEIEYKPPRNLRELIARVNRMVPNPNGIGKPLYEPDKLTSQSEKALQMLLGWVNIIRFTSQASNYLKRVDRDLFESTFFGQLHDKIDLTREDVEQYITYCSSIVNAAQMERTIQRLQTQVDEAFEAQDKVSMTLVDHLNNLNDNLKEEKNRQAKLYQTLNGARSTRLNDMTQASLSMHPLVSAWQKKEGRAKLLAVAGDYQDKLAAEVQRLTKIDRLKAEIYGIDAVSIIR